MMCPGSAGELSAQMRFDGFQVYRVTPQTIEQLETLKELEDNPMDYNFWTYVSIIGRPVDIMVPPNNKSDFLDLLQNMDAELWIENVQERVDDERRAVLGKRKKYRWKHYQTLDEVSKLKISPATVTFILNNLVRSKNPAIRCIAESREWHVFPCVNPDGYVFSHICNRMWRKNRKPYGKHFGVDLNRNWNFHWSEGRTSTNPASDTFAGNVPFSEIETETLSRYISGIADRIEVYLAFHSYSQKILIPFGHKGNNRPYNYEEHQRIGEAAAESLASRYGTQFRVGNRADILYPAGGVSADWAKAVHNIRLAFIYELRDTGRYGFLLPPKQIIATGRETFDSIIRIFQELDDSSGIASELEYFQRIAPEGEDSESIGSELEDSESTASLPKHCS